MNKKGFTLVELLAVIVIISLIMIIVYPNIIRIINDNNEEIYHGFERMMVEYAEVSPLKTANTIMLKDLNIDKALDSIKDSGCNGYVSIDHTHIPITYQAYIKCSDDKYVTCYDKGEPTEICYDENLQEDA